MNAQSGSQTSAVVRSSSARSRLESPILCPACNAPPRATLRLANGSMLLRCPACLLGWWGWPAFSPESLYDESYFQSAEQAKGYADYASLEPSIRLTARGRLDEIDRCRTTRSLFGPQDSRLRRPRAFNGPLGAKRFPQLGGYCGALAARGARSVANDRFAERETRSHWPHGPLHEISRENAPYILDIGCSTGVFLDEARARGWRAHGLEVSDYAVQVARRRGLAVRRAAVEELSLPSAAFDCITMWDVIEHLRDPIGVFGEVSAALRPGGVFALSTGDITSFCARLSGSRWHLFNLPEHLFFYSPRSLQLLLARAGLRVVAIRREISWYTADYLFERLAKTLLRRKWSAGPLRDWLQSLQVPASLGDIVSVYARKSPSA